MFGRTTLHMTISVAVFRTLWSFITLPQNVNRNLHTVGIS